MGQKVEYVFVEENGRRLIFDRMVDGGFYCKALKLK